MADEIDLEKLRTIVQGAEAWERICDADPTIGVQGRALAKLRAALREYVKANDLHHRQIWIDADDDPDSAETLTFELEDAREHAIEGEFGMHLDEMSGRGLWIMTEIAELLTEFECCWTPETNAEMKKVRETIANDPMAVAIQRALKARKERK